MKYVLVTPARNEEAFIAKTIESVVAQTMVLYEVATKEQITFRRVA